MELIVVILILILVIVVATILTSILKLSGEAVPSEKYGAGDSILAKIIEMIRSIFGVRSAVPSAPAHYPVVLVTQSGTFRDPIPLQKVKWNHTGRAGLEELITLGKELGRGNFGVVSMGTLYTDKTKTTVDKIVIIKEQNTIKDNRGMWDIILEEVRAYDAAAVADCKHLAQLYEVFASQNENKVYYVMEHIEGQNLSSIIKKAFQDESGNRIKSFGEYKANITKIWPTQRNFIDKVINPIVDAITCLHRNGFAHRDIKPENIMVKSDNTVVVIDLGVNCRGDNCQVISGDQYYKPPELWSKMDATSYNYFNSKVRLPIVQLPASKPLDLAMREDVWLVGSTIFEILMGQLLIDYGTVDPKSDLSTFEARVNSFCSLYSDWDTNNTVCNFLKGCLNPIEPMRTMGLL